MVSIVIACRNEGENLKRTLQSIIDTPVNQLYEIIVVDDGSNDDCYHFLDVEEWPMVTLIKCGHIGVGPVRNIGVQKSKGEVLLFCDAHIFVEPYWMDILMANLFRPGVGAVSPVIVDHYNREVTGYGLGWHNPIVVNWLPGNDEISPAPVLPAGCMVVKKEVFLEVGGFDEGLKKFFHEDMELSTKIWLYGYEALVIPYVRVSHIFKPRAADCDYNPLYYNVLRIGFYHFKPERIAKLIHFLKETDAFAGHFTEIIFDDTVWATREHHQNNRQFNDDWLTEKFCIPF